MTLPRRRRSDASNQLRFEPLEPRVMLTGDGLLGEYFNSISLTQLASSRVDAVVNFPNDALGEGAQGQVTADDNYSIRWTGWVETQQAGSWQFTTHSNDGVRLWVDDTQIIDNWDQHASERDDGNITLAAGWHPIRMEYFQQGGTTDARLLFSGPGQSEVIIPQSRLSSTDPNAGDPVANAGVDRVVVLPASSVVLDGSGTDNGAITAYQWSQISGPNTATLSGATTEDLTASNLIEGVYVFQLTVTDNESNTDNDTATVQVVPASGSGIISGELQQWHKVSIDFTGPTTSETAATNPFMDYRLDVAFSHAGTGKSYVVPGYYAADGNAANTSATSGNVWRVHFAPDEIGAWTYSASFRTGSNVAVSTAANPGTSAGFFDGTAGAFEIAPSDKSGRDLRGKGRLEYVGERYLKFAGDGEYFLKQGPDAPENLLAYEDFDNTPNNGNRRKSYSAHAGDWNPGDPSWHSGKGTELIGAVNYLASEGLNAFSFLPMNIAGDDENVFPYISDASADRTRMDVSKLAQWEIVFEHATKEGFFLHFKTQETENDQLLDGGALGNQRRLYYRELIARFSHHLALNWNLGEENTNTTQQRKDFAQFFYDNDPYRHHIVLHTYPTAKDSVYDPLLGNASKLTGASLQTNQANFTNVHADTVKWVNDSAAAGKPWAIAVDEPGDAQHALRPDNDAGNSHEDGRKNALWGTLMGGGYGNEWYFGYGHAHSDLTLEDFRSRDDWWDYTRYAMEFFQDNDIPFWQMQNDNSISTASNDYGFYKPGEVYVAYLKNGGTTNLDLSNVSGTYDVRWFDPRNGGALQVGNVSQVTGGDSRGLGTAPNNTTQDWAILVRRQASNGPNEPPSVSIDNFAEVVDSGTEGVYQEAGGLVVMEMENTASNLGLWNEETTYANYTGDGYLQFTGNSPVNGPPTSPLEYKFKITQPGLYYLHLRAAKDTTHGQPSDQSNDAYVRVEGDYNAGPNAGNNHGDDAPLSMLMSDTKFFGGAANSFAWASGNQLDPGGHMNKRVAVYDFKAGEEYTLVISGRSQWFSLDRIVFRHASVGTSAAQNLSNPESSQSGAGGGILGYQIDATVADDGQVVNPPALQWTKVSGPGNVVFDDPNVEDPFATFSVDGTYELRLTADVGEFTTSRTRTIVVPFVDTPTGPNSLVAGWDTWNSGSSPTASETAAGITGSAVTTSEGIAWHTSDGRGASADGDWGTFAGPPTASTVAGDGVTGENLELSNATTGGTITFTISNNGTTDLALDGFHFDAYAFRPKAARAYELSVSSGDITNGVIYTSADDEITSVGGAWNNLAHDDISHSLSGLADNILEVGGSVDFLLTFSSGAGDGSGGHDLWVDNVAVTAVDNTISSDFDGDGDVDGADFLTWQRGVGLPNTRHYEGDANGDDLVNGADLSIWQNSYGTGSAATSSSLQASSPLASSNVLAAEQAPLIESSEKPQAATSISQLPPSLVDAAMATRWLEASSIDSRTTEKLVTESTHEEEIDLYYSQTAPPAQAAMAGMDVSLERQAEADSEAEKDTVLSDVEFKEIISRSL